MEMKDVLPLLAAYHRKINDTDLRFKRYLGDQVNWQARLIGIKGDRGVGKTTMILQHIKDTFNKIDDAFYVSLDNLWFQNHSATELIDFLYNRGRTHIFLDEVHRFADWTAFIKNLYDDYPDLHIVYTGSSMLSIDHSKADLSRRQSLYTLNGLSFREFLEYEGVAEFPSITLEDLVQNHVEYAMNVASKVKILKYFEQYLDHGYYPYYKEAGRDYLTRLAEVAQLVIDGDITAVEESITYATRQKLKKLLMVIADNVPLEPNISRLAESLESTRDHTLKMLYWLDRAGLLFLLTQNIKDYKHLVGPSKVYLNNTNIMAAVSSKTSIGTARETFFANQVGAVATLQMPKHGDFFVGGKYLFEVGGAQKTFKQIADIPDSYLAIDGVETGMGNRIPLWAFGCLY